MKQFPAQGRVSQLLKKLFFLYKKGEKVSGKKKLNVSN